MRATWALLSLAIATAPSLAVAQQGPPPDQAQFEGALELRARGRAGEAIASLEELMAHGGPAWGLRVVGTLADLYSQVGDWGRAAYLVEHEARSLSAPAFEARVRVLGVDGLRRAVELRLAEANVDQAMNDAGLLLAFFGERGEGSEAAVGAMFSLAAFHERQGTWHAAELVYRNVLRTSDQRLSVDQRAVALVGLGRAQEHLGGPTIDAPISYRRALALVGERDEPVPSPHATAHAQQGVPGHPFGLMSADLGVHGCAPCDEDTCGRDTARYAVAEARFRLAEMDFNPFAQQRPPAFHGTTRAAWETWMRRTALPSVRDRVARAEVLLSRYERVTATNVSPWHVAALARTGDLLSAVAGFVAGIPRPPGEFLDPALGDAYRSMTQSLGGSLSDRAVLAYRSCVHASTASQLPGEWLAHCEVRMEELTRTEHALTEIAPLPLLVSRMVPVEPVLRDPRR